MTPTTEQLKDLLDKVTPGQWRKVFYDGPDNVGYTVDGVGYAFCDADATLIALAPTLAAEVVSLRVLIEQWEGRIDDCELSINTSCTSGVREEMRQALDATSDA